MNHSRRGFLFGAAATIVAAPAIVRVAASLMPISTRYGISEMERRKLEFIEKLARPPLLAMPTLKNEPASLRPGWITYIDSPVKPMFAPAFEVLPRSFRATA